MTSDAMFGEASIETYWADLVTAALLGSDRREPPPAPAGIADVVADAVRPEPSARLLVAVAACATVRRAGVLPGPFVDPLVPPAPDLRPACVPAAVDRWHHVTSAWPVLEDEWLLTLIEQGWRLAPELVPALLRRHRRDPLRRARVAVAAGPLAAWVLDHVPDLGPWSSSTPLSPLEAEHLGELPRLPLPPDFEPLLDGSGPEVGGFVASGLEDRLLVESHRPVLVNLVARCSPDGLVDIAEILDAVDQRSAGFGLATSLADLATTRARMLDELTAP